MDAKEFGKVWTLMGELFPPSPKLKSKNSKLVWEIGLSPYDLQAVTNALMAYARKNKFFPDLADITGNLPEPEAAVTEGAAPGPGDISLVLPYMRKLAEQQSTNPAMARALHLIGMQTLPEAEADGMTWEEWEAAVDARRHELPPRWCDFKRQGLTFAESAEVIRAAWADFWRLHGEPDHGMP